jgi:hypothetical protein
MSNERAEMFAAITHMVGSIGLAILLWSQLYGTLQQPLA